MRLKMVVRDVVAEARHTRPDERPRSRFASLSDVDPAVDPVQWARRRDELFRRERERVMRATGDVVTASEDAGA